MTTTCTHHNGRQPVPGALIPGVTGVVLAGGASSRMGTNKALLPAGGGRLIETVYLRLAGLFAEVLVIANEPQLYPFIPCRKVADRHPGFGPLAGVHAGLFSSSNPAVFVAACDMPYLNGALIRHLAGALAEYDAVVPCGPEGMEPLHGVYARRALPAMEEFIAQGERKILDLLDLLRVRLVSAEEVARFDPRFATFVNINTPEEYRRFLAGEGKGEGRID